MKRRTGRAAAATPLLTEEQQSGTLTEEQLLNWGKAAGAAVARPVFFALSGELGAGKSVLARALASGAGVQSHMPSPTYNLLFRYETEAGDVYHLDLYRLEREEEVLELGWRELGAGADMVIVEWPERAGSMLPAPRWDVRLEETAPWSRRILLSPVGQPPSLPPLPQ